MLLRGWESIGKDVCNDCVTNPHLQAIVQAEAESDIRCSYCGQAAGQVAVVDADHVMAATGEAFSTEYADPVEELPYETREGGYLGKCRTAFTSPSTRASA